MGSVMYQAQIWWIHAKHGPDPSQCPLLFVTVRTSNLWCDCVFQTESFARRVRRELTDKVGDKLELWKVLLLILILLVTIVFVIVISITLSIGMGFLKLIHK